MPRGYNSEGQLVGASAETAAGRYQPPPPKGYPDEVKAEVLQHIANGLTPERIEERDGMPTARAIRYWVQWDPVFSEAYSIAHRHMATALLDHALENADEAHDKDSAMAARVKAETRLKVAQMLDPAKYGRQASGGALSVTINTNLGGAGQAPAGGAYTITIEGESVQETCSEPALSGKSLTGKDE